MHNQERLLLFLGKANDWHTNRALAFCRRNFSTVRAELGEWGDPFPRTIVDTRWDCIISYLSRWIVPGAMLGPQTTAINFHPGPPEYPGYGCNNFAVYDGATEFGVTCHHMNAKVDTGPVIAVVRFPVLPSDTGGTLLLRTYDHQLVLFYDIVGRIVRGDALPCAGDAWAGPPSTRRQLEQLGCITPEMSEAEAAKRRRATDVSVLRRPA